MLNVKFDTSSRKRAGRFNLAAALTMRTPMKRKKIVLRPIVLMLQQAQNNLISTRQTNSKFRESELDIERCMDRSSRSEVFCKKDVL